MEKGLSQFLKVPIVYDRAKNKKNKKWLISEENSELIDG